MSSRYHPDRSAFHAARRRTGGTLVPVCRELVCDGETPVGLYARLGRRDYSFLLESAAGDETWAGYSFLGVAPRAVLRLRDGRAETVSYDLEGSGAPTSRVEDASDPALALQRFVAPFRAVLADGPSAWPRFVGGAVGFLGYDAVRAWEPVTVRDRRAETQADDTPPLPTACFVLTDTLLAFDHRRQTVKLIACAHVAPDADEAAADRAYDAACARIDSLETSLARPAAPALPLLDLAAPAAALPVSRTPRADFLDAVRRAKEHILAGDAFQIVLSQRFEAARDGADPFDVYRALRAINPSPYMFHLQFPEAVVTGASPETLVRVEAHDGARRVSLRPLAGTRRRGKSAEEDARLAAELLADEKERAEHVMLIDLARNDVGRVARIGTVRVEEQMVIERFSHVMHLVSLVTGEVAPEHDALDVLRAAFPAGTLSGAPKVRAMQIIDTLEPVARGVYGGAVGYLGFPTVGDDGQAHANLDLAIAIRTLVTRGERVYVQAGAGIVHDSVPEAEYDETLHKARAVLRALEVARSARRREDGR